MDRGPLQVRHRDAKLVVVNDAWEQHVLLEISDALGDGERLYEIQEALMLMWQRDLMPEETSNRIWLYFYDIGGL